MADKNQNQSSKKESLDQELRDKVLELDHLDDRSPMGDEFGILSELKRLKFDESSLSDSSPIDFVNKVSTPITPNTDKFPIEYMWKGDGQINTKFYPPKLNISKEDSNSNTPENRLNFSTFTTYLENNP